MNTSRPKPLPPSSNGEMSKPNTLADFIFYFITVAFLLAVGFMIGRFF